MNWWRSIAALQFLIASFLFGAPSTPAPAADIFARTSPVLRIKVEIAKEHIRSLQNEPRKDVPATVREGAKVYTNVLVHIKGSAGSIRPIHENPALTLTFAKGDSPQRFHGLRKIHLNNSVQDQSFSTEIIVGEMFREAGIPTPRGTNARFMLNGRDLGFYVVKEGFTKEFLAMYFENTKGNLYDGGFLKDITQRLEKDSGDDRKDQPDLDALVATARLDPATRWPALEKILDTDRFLTFMAIESLTWDWDGYMMKPNNYRVYHDPKSNKMVFLPHGLDQMFHETDRPVFNPNIRGLVARAVVETPEGRKLFRERVKQVFAKHYRIDALTNRLDFLTKRNREAVAELGRGALRDYENNIASVRARIIRRWESCKDQIENEQPPVAFDKGAIAIRRWRPQTESGDARLDQTNENGKPSLHITANGQTSASWRSTVQLDPGRYRFSALARTKNLSPRNDEKGQGAGLRISGYDRPRANKLNGTADWTNLQFDFDAPGGGDIVLVCESRANRGEVWFDLNSLKLEKLK
jgi:spore coat protein H